MALHELHYLLLSELTHTRLLNAPLAGSIMEVVQVLKPELARRHQQDLAEAILGSSVFADFEIVTQQIDGHPAPDWTLLLNEEQRQAVIVISDFPELEQDDAYMSSLDERIHKLQKVLTTVDHLVCTGLGHGGWRAAALADALGAEAVVFGAPTIEELPGRALNYIGEDDPAGDHIEKVVFVKQTEEPEEGHAHFYQRLIFNEDGKAMIAEQSDFSKFVTWFYDTAGSVEPDVWTLFFPGLEEEESVILADLGIYSVFLKASELNQESLLRAIDEVVRMTAGRLERNRRKLLEELDKLPAEDDNSFVLATTEKYMEQTSEYILSIFESVQTILMGVSLYTMEQEAFDMDSAIDKLQVQINDLLDAEVEQVKVCLDQAIARNLEKYFEPPQFSFEF